MSVSGLTKSYKGNRVLNEVSFSVNAGEVLTILGPNGAGKTTLFKILAGLTDDYEGSYHIEGLKGKHKERIGFVFDSSRAFYPKLTAIENLLYFGALRGLSVKSSRKRANELLKKFALSEKADLETQKLSRGMLQRLSLCLALMSNPTVLLLDEPTLGLDIESQRDFEECINEVRGEGAIILIATHQMDTAQKLGSYSLLLNKGRVLRFGRTQQLLSVGGSDRYTIKTLNKLPQQFTLQLHRMTDHEVMLDTSLCNLNDVLSSLLEFNVISIEKQKSSLEMLIRKELKLS